MGHKADPQREELQKRRSILEPHEQQLWASFEVMGSTIRGASIRCALFEDALNTDPNCASWILKNSEEKAWFLACSHVLYSKGGDVHDCPIWRVIDRILNQVVGGNMRCL